MNTEQLWKALLIEDGADVFAEFEFSAPDRQQAIDVARVWAANDVITEITSGISLFLEYDSQTWLVERWDELHPIKSASRPERSHR